MKTKNMATGFMFAVVLLLSIGSVFAGIDFKQNGKVIFTKAPETNPIEVPETSPIEVPETTKTPTVEFASRGTGESKRVTPHIQYTADQHSHQIYGGPAEGHSLHPTYLA